MASEQAAASVEYSFANETAHLDELAAPAPIRSYRSDHSRQSDVHGSHVEERHKHHLRIPPAQPAPDHNDDDDDGDEEHEYKSLTEVAAPNPVDEAREETRLHLEDTKRQEADQDDNTPSTVASSSIPSAASQPARRRSRAAIEVYTLAYLIVFSIFGTLARLGLQALTVYSGAPLATGVIWANVAGSLILGYLSEDRQLFRDGSDQRPTSRPDPPTNSVENGDAGEARHRRGRRRRRFFRSASATTPRTASAMTRHTAAKKTLPLYIGLATGFCGSFTSFSSFTRDAFYALANALPTPSPYTTPSPAPTPLPRNGGYSFMATLAVLISTTGLSLGGLQVGAHLALALDAYTPVLPRALFGPRHILDRIALLLATAFVTAVTVLTILVPAQDRRWRAQALLALAFAPLGCIARFYASVLLNSRVQAFPLGTFTVNVVGSLLDAGFVSLQRVAPSGVGGTLACEVLQGMQDGFCGALTTVSTWVLEIRALRRRHAYVYALSSMAVALAGWVVIAGPVLWTKGWGSATCHA